MIYIAAVLAIWGGLAYKAFITLLEKRFPKPTELSKDSAEALRADIDRIKLALGIRTVNFNNEVKK